jgi:hypothetical protein
MKPCVQLPYKNCAVYNELTEKQLSSNILKVYKRLKQGSISSNIAGYLSVTFLRTHFKNNSLDRKYISVV